MIRHTLICIIEPTATTAHGPRTEHAFPMLSRPGPRELDSIILCMEEKQSRDEWKRLLVLLAPLVVLKYSAELPVNTTYMSSTYED